MEMEARVIEDRVNNLRYRVYMSLALVAMTVFYLQFIITVGWDSKITNFNSLIFGYISWPFDYSLILDLTLSWVWTYFTFGLVWVCGYDRDDLMMLAQCTFLGMAVIFCCSGNVEIILALSLAIGLTAKFFINDQPNTTSCLYVGFLVGVSLMVGIFYGFICGMTCYVLYIGGLFVYMIFDLSRRSKPVNRITRVQ